MVHQYSATSPIDTPKTISADRMPESVGAPGEPWFSRNGVTPSLARLERSTDPAAASGMATSSRSNRRHGWPGDLSSLFETLDEPSANRLAGELDPAATQRLNVKGPRNPEAPKTPWQLLPPAPGSTLLGRTTPKRQRVSSEQSNRRRQAASVCNDNRPSEDRVMRDYGIGLVIGLVVTATLAPLVVVVVEMGLCSPEMGWLVSRTSQLFHLAQAAFRLWRLGA